MADATESKSNLLASLLPGILLCLGLALLAQTLGEKIPLIGAPVMAILLGIVVGNLAPLQTPLKPGVAYCAKKVLQLAIIVLGGSLSLAQVIQAGRNSLAVMLITLVCALGLAYILGKVLRVGRNLTTLVGVGTSICGGSAIAAVAPIVQADDDEIAFSISTVFLFNIVAVLVFPALGHMMHLSQSGFGIWAGTAINDTSSVLAAAFSYGKEAGDIATVTKLARTTMIVPIAVLVAVLMSRRGSQTQCNIARVFPWFILGFLGLSVINSTSVLGPQFPALAAPAGRFLIAVALAGVGLGANFARMVKTGPRPVILGLLCWVGVAVSSLIVQTIIRQM